MSDALKISVEIDSDTQGEPGTPPITDTILRKIRDCDAFVGDMTFVAATSGGKLLPNPNVMGEYGYALAEKGTRRIILVMNTAFGPAGELPFDLGHLRKPIGFEASERITDSARRAARSKFASELETAIKLVVAGARADDGGSAANAMAAAKATLAELSTQTEFGSKPAVISQPKVVLHLAPFAAFAGTELDTRNVSAVIGALKPSDLPTADSGLDESEWWVSGRGSIVPGRPNPESTWYSRIHQPGVFEVALNLGKLVDDDPRVLVDGYQVEAAIVEMVDKCSLAAASLGLAGGGLVTATLIGAQDCDVIIKRSSGRFRKPAVSLGQVSVSEVGARLGDHLQPIFDRLWMAAGLASGSTSFQHDGWAGYRGERPYAL